jgi:hypothetical protein
MDLDLVLGLSLRSSLDSFCALPPGRRWKSRRQHQPPHKDLDPVDSGLPGTPHIGGFANAPRA